MKKEFSTFKVLGITLLVTMSSCVVGYMELNAEMLRNYGLELDISLSDKTQVIHKQKKSKISSTTKFRIGSIIESGRTNITVAGLSIDYTPILFGLRFAHYPNKLLNSLIAQGSFALALSYHGLNFQNRAGPCAC